MDRRFALLPEPRYAAFGPAARLSGLYDKWAARVGAQDWPTAQQSRMPTAAP